MMMKMRATMLMVITRMAPTSVNQMKNNTDDDLDDTD